MNEIVDRDTFLYYLDNADVNWEATARECIAKGFELAEENKKLKEDVDLFRKAHDNEQAQRRMFETKLEKIKEYALSRMTGLACRHILNIIEGAEDE